MAGSFIQNHEILPVLVVIASMVLLRFHQKDDAGFT
jgi:hypothetical protein